MLAKFMRPDDVAECLAISRKTVYKLVEKGELEALKCGSAVCVLIASVEAYIARHKKVSVPPVTEPKPEEKATRPRDRSQGRKRGERKGFRHCPPK